MKKPEFHPSLRRTQVLLVTLAIVLTPLCFFPFIHQQFTWSKIAWLQTIGGLVILAGLARLVRGETLRVHFSPVGLLTAGLVAWHVLLWPFAESASLAAERIALLVCIACIAWFWHACLCHPAKKRMRLLAALYFLAIVAALVSAWALAQDILAQTQTRIPILSRFLAVGQNYLGDWRGAITASFGNTDFIAAFLATLYIPILLFYLHVRSRARVIFLGLTLFLMTSALIVCWSVGANGALILSSVAVLALLGPRRLRQMLSSRARRFAVWTVSCLLAILWFVTPNPLNPHHPGIFQEAFGSERWIAGGPTRWVIWLNTLSIIQENPVLGVGPGNFTYAYPRQDSALIPLTFEWQKYAGSYTNAAHNALLQMWAETGPLGATLLLLVAVAVLHRLILPTKYRRAEEQGHPLNALIAAGLAGAFLVICLDGMMTFPLQLPSLLLLFFILIASSSLLAGETENVVDIILPLGRSAVETDATGGRWGECRFALKDMRRPVAVDIRLRLPRALQALSILTGILLFGLFMVWTWRIIVADYYFLPARQTFAMMNATGSSSELMIQQTLDNSLKASRIAPRHHDAQGVAGQMYLRRREPEKALEMFEQVFKRLDSSIYYYYRAQALHAVGREDEALADMKTFRERQPFRGMPPPAASR